MVKYIEEFIIQNEQLRNIRTINFQINETYKINDCYKLKICFTLYKYEGMTIVHKLETQIIIDGVTPVIVAYCNINKGKIDTKIYDWDMISNDLIESIDEVFK